ncbi:MAG: transcriptional repressor [Clostridiales Family XIII bacterium]|jgi:Fur family ferric uptake transcriptional regulator|nr:transcriptional repressor [Clostridiales Family XIII bacterium]
MGVNGVTEHRNGWPPGIKRTKQREAVLSVLERADGPLSAVDIRARTESDGDGVWLSTVYRILETFVNKGIVQRLAIMTGDMAVYELNRSGHRHYAVCVGCRKIISMDNCPMERFIPELADGAFRVTGHNLEVYGYCGDCDGYN